jgi:hypothetical protein
MGEEVTQYEMVNSHTDNSASNDSTGCDEQDVKGESIDEVDKTIVASSPPASDDECPKIKFIEKCEEIKANCDHDDDNSLVQQQKQQMDKSAKKLPNVNGHKPNEVSIEKSKKWYNISFINRGNHINNGNAINATAVAANSRSNNSDENKNSDKMDKRHSWHLNDSAVVQM